MSTTRLFGRSVLAISLVAVLSGYGLAAGQAGQADYRTADELARDMDEVWQESDVPVANNVKLRRANELIGSQVKSTQGQTLGTIYDIVLAKDLDSVDYVALSRGGIFGIGRSLHAIPWSAMRVGLDGNYVVPISESQLRQSLGFRADRWPVSPERGWTTATMDDGETPMYRGFTPQESREVQFRRFSRIKGSPTKTSAGENVGDVQDLVIAMHNGQIVYTILSFGGVLGLGQQYVAVPHSAVSLEPGIRVARVDVDRAALQANAFPPGRFPDLADPAYSQRLARAYGQEMEWTALGYVAPEERPTTEPAQPREGITAEPPQPPMEMAAPTESELTGTFDPAQVRTIEGTVTEAGKYRCSKTGLDMLWLRVRTDEGRTVTVNAGPRDYVAKQDFYIVKGDRIRLTGSEVASATAGKRVFLPSEIVFGTHTLRLADASGRPLWEAQMRETERRPMEPQPRSQEQPTPDESGVLGYVPGEEQAAPEKAEPGMVGTQAIGAFDLTNLRTIEGTITEVGKTAAAEGGPDMLWLRATTADGRPIYVQVGPRDYISRQNFFVVPGDKVRMTGWDVRAGADDATPVFVLADITHNGQILQLRNRSSQPLWGPQTGVTGQQPGTPGQLPAEENAADADEIME